MRIRCGYDIAYETTTDVPMMLMLHVRPERVADLITPENFAVTPDTPWRSYSDRFGNRCTRLVAPPGITRFTADFIIQDSGLPDAILPEAVQHPVDELPEDVLIYLLGSRYCETDKMSNLAWSLFQNYPPGWQRAQAIVKYAHERVTFGYPHARPTRTAWEAHEEQKGVCRDFAHLAVTLCRCMNIPARYCTGYLGDIGIPFDPSPMDFSAWFEAYLGGRWHTFDARHNKPRIGRIAMAHGRDATDTAISNAFGWANLVNFTVISEELPESR